MLIDPLKIFFSLIIVIIAGPAISLIMRFVSNGITGLGLYHKTEEKRLVKVYLTYLSLGIPVFFVIYVILSQYFKEGTPPEIMAVTLGAFYVIPLICRISALSSVIPPRLLSETRDETEVEKVWKKESERMKSAIFSIVAFSFVLAVILINYFIVVEKKVFSGYINVSMAEGFGLLICVLVIPGVMAWIGEKFLEKTGISEHLKI